MTRIENLETLLTSSDTKESVIKLSCFITKACDYGDSMEKLTKSQKQFYYNREFEREVNNGGFAQYFFNSSGDFVHQTIHSLRAIGADTTANILQEAIDQFPDKNVPQDRTERYKILEQIQDTAKPIWDEIEKRFFEYPDDLNILNLDFVKQNKNDF